MALHICIFSLFLVLVSSCTDFLITPGATQNGASMVTYNTDSHQAYGYLARYPAADYPAGSMLKVYDWESGEYLGSIPQVRHTYSVVGNMNEFQLVIGESTWGGLASLQSQPGAIIDYGSLIYITLQRAKNAREAISVMTNLVNKYGYASEGESFSIADPQEVWILELIGKGNVSKGAVWVAKRIPDGYVCAHANQARITTFDVNDSLNTMYAPDVISFAKNNGYYPMNSDDSSFSFSDTYNPLTFEGARACEARVFSFFSKVTTGMEVYLDYAQGFNLTNRMPLWVKPTNKLDLKTVMMLMRDHFENTWFDFRQDVGAGAFGLPYRWRPLTWNVDDDEYLNERAISTQQTANTFVSMSRSYLPNAVGGVVWFGVDDSAMTVHAPFYCGITDIPSSLEEDGPSNLMSFSFDSAFWVFNLVSNYVYSRYRIMYPEVLSTILSYESSFMKQADAIELQAVNLLKQGNKQQAITLLTNFSVGTYDNLVSDWLKYFQYLFVKYMDGNIKTPTGNPKQPIVKQPGYGDAQYERIVAETGDRYLVPSSKTNNVRHKNVRSAPQQSRRTKL